MATNEVETGSTYDYQELLAKGDFVSLKELLGKLSPPDIAEILQEFETKDSSLVFRLMPKEKASLVFEYLSTEKQTELVQSLADEHLVSLLNSMAPDDRTRLFEELPPEVTKRALSILNPEELKIARQLLGYQEGSAGRFMTPRYVAIRGEMTAFDAITIAREQGRDPEMLNVLYVTDEKGKLINSLRLSTLVLAKPLTKVGDLIAGEPLVSILATFDREEVISTFEKYDAVALPVTDSSGHLLGIITIDDVLDAAEEEATEDMQKIGGMEALEAPYLQNTFGNLLKKRVGWLLILFMSELLTATAMQHFQDQFYKVLIVFIPLIVSSGGNSGSQAASLIIRSLATKDITLSDWWKVLRREIFSGLTLGGILGVVGFIRVFSFGYFHLADYGPHYVMIAFTILFSLIGIVLFGTLVGSMFPLLLRKLGLDPATASAPFVATLVDVTGIVIYFEVAMFVLRGLNLGPLSNCQ